MVAKGRAARKPPAPRKKRPPVPRPVTITVTTTYRLTEEEYNDAVSNAIGEMESYSYGAKRIPKTVKTTIEGVK